MKLQLGLWTQFHILLIIMQVGPKWLRFFKAYVIFCFQCSISSANLTHTCSNEISEK
jgi:hypothetical protein